MTQWKTSPQQQMLLGGAVLLLFVVLALAGGLLPESVLEVWAFGTSKFLLEGAWNAIQIAVLSLVLGLILGLALALMRLSQFQLLRGVSWFYIWFVRGTPLILQLVFLFDALPVIGIKLDSYTTAVLGFTLNEAAFCAEIIRGGIISVDRKQTLAAGAFGMGPWLTMRRIVLPQAMRVFLPGMGNQAINLIKGTSIASVIFVNELTFRSQQIVGQNFKFFTVFGAAGLIYLLMTSGISVIVGKLEKRYSLDRERRVAPDDMPPELVGSGMQWINGLAQPDAASQISVDGQDYVQCHNVQKSYDGREILRGIDLDIRRGEVVVLMGPSGSGKSTLLRLVNHLEPLDWGEIKVDGKYVGYERVPGGALKSTGNLARARADARIGMVFQHFNLFDHLTALENVMEAPVRVYGEKPEAAREKAMRLLDMVGLGSHMNHKPHRLSGGQQQRVAIARALAISPSLMLFDEPTSALDPERVGEVLNVIRQLAGAGMTMMIVTHEVRFARDVADRVVFMDEGLVVESGPPEQVLDAPRHERTRRFLRMVEGEAA
jgi:polar amino acid transport system permease protein